VTLRVTDPALRTLDVVTVSPFLAVGSVPADLDTDGDGLTDLFEATLSCGDPSSADADRDGTTDDREDCDGDGLTNAREQSLLTDPDNPDSDADGVSDRFELTAGCDPRLKQTATVTGRVVDADGVPVAGVLVVPLIAPSVSTATDATGVLRDRRVPDLSPEPGACQRCARRKLARGVSGLVSTTAGTDFDAGNIRLHPCRASPTPSRTSTQGAAS